MTAQGLTVDNRPGSWVMAMEPVRANKRPRDDDGEGALDRVKRMRVSELRQELTKSGLDTDGARAELEARLREQLGRGA